MKTAALLTTALLVLSCKGDGAKTGSAGGPAQEDPKTARPPAGAPATGGAAEANRPEIDKPVADDPKPDEPADAADDERPTVSCTGAASDDPDPVCNPVFECDEGAIYEIHCERDGKTMMTCTCTADMEETATFSLEASRCDEILAVDALNERCKLKVVLVADDE